LYGKKASGILAYYFNRSIVIFQRLRFICEIRERKVITVEMTQDDLKASETQLWHDYKDMLIEAISFWQFGCREY